jgi:hypothetical protein
LKSVNATLSLNAKQIKTSSMMFADSNVTLSLQDGLLTIKPLNSLVVGGSIDLNGKLHGAKTGINLNISGSGDSVGQIMADLNGKLLVKVDKGVSTDLISRALVADVLTKLVNMLNPFSQSSDNTQLECAVVNFDIKEGMAITDKGIAISTSQMNIIGSGVINLKTEGLDIGIKPEAKQGLGLNAGKLASFVRVGGNLANPQATTDLTGALSSGLSVSTAFATGGLSLLAEGLFNRVTADANPCATARGQKSATTQSTKQPEKSTSTKAADAIKDASGVVGKTIKGFFN